MGGGGEGGEGGEVELGGEKLLSVCPASVYRCWTVKTVMFCPRRGC